MKNQNIAIILASGIGKRFESSIPKQFVKLNGKIVVLYVLDEVIKSKIFNKIIVTLPSKKYEYIFKLYNINCILGGKTRNESLYNALKFINKYKPENIMIFDSVRPLIKAEDISQYIKVLNNTDCSLTYEPIIDALFHDDRNKYKLIQAPEAYKYQLLYNKFDKEINHVSPYLHIYPCNIEFIRLTHPNYKLTYKHDLFTFEQLIKYTPYRYYNFYIKDKIILVFGGTGGIGKELLKHLNYYNAKIIAPTGQEIDLSTDFLSFLQSKNYNPDIIINVSGKSFNDENGILEHYIDIMNVNVKANLQLIEYAKSLNKKVNMIFISSSSATKGRENLTVYSASKTALHSIVESQAEKLSKQNIILNCICPEKINTSLLKRLHRNNFCEGEILSVEEVVKVILNYCDTDNYGNIIHLKKGFYEL